MTGMTQPSRAEGAPDDEPRADRPDKQGVSAETPAEGADDLPGGGGKGAPRG